MNLIRRTIQRLIEAKFGDANELERLYGGDFNTQGKISHSAHNDDELEVPTIVRQHLVNHGFKYVGSLKGESPGNHVYAHQKNHSIVINQASDSMTWYHRMHNTDHVIKSGNDLPSLVHHLTHYQQ